MQFWSRFSKDAFALGMGSLVCFTAPHCLRMGLSWSRKDSCCSPSRLHCACPCTITAFSWRRSLFGKCSQRSDLPQGAEVPGEAPGSRLQLCSDWSQRLSHQQPPPCFLREPKPHLALVLLMPLQFQLQPVNDQVCGYFSSHFAPAMENRQKTTEVWLYL